MKLTYRPEIDGLRAVAVVLVILFHAGFQPFSGGFVGVDVFFVISGYLITSIIVKDVEAGKFSFWEFYERRARRILPALFLVMICCIPFAWAWMLPFEMRAFSSSIVSVCLFVSNILFWNQAGYFDSVSELKPLLHTWSLAVEEQFYIIFPIAVLLIWRFGKRSAISLVAIVALISLTLSQYSSHYFPGANFYLLPTRAWELMAGSLCSFVVLRAHLVRDQLLSLMGLAAIIVSALIYGKATPFPSIYALLPVLGTCAFLLFARQGTLVGRVLSLKPIVGVGLISYSAYLWHQPLFAFARIRAVPEPSWHLMVALTFASLMLAYVSWRFVEVPARKGKFWPLATRRSLFVTFAALGAVLVVAGSAGFLANGFPSRMSPELAALEHRVDGNRGLSGDCDGDSSMLATCRTSEAPEVLLWGDSFGMHLLDGLQASNPQLAVAQMTMAACGPLLGVAPTSAALSVRWANKCLKFNDQVLAYAKRTKSLRFAVLSSPFHQFVNDGSEVLTADQRVVEGSEVALESFKHTLETLETLGIRPIVVSPPPSPGFDAGRCLVNAVRFKEDIRLCDFPLKQSRESQGQVREFLTEISKSYPVLWLDAALCEKDFCASSVNGTFIYRDGAHLSHEGSAYIGRKFDLYNVITAGRF